MSDDTFTAIVFDHLSRYPLIQPADLYKLAYQAALGSEHAAGNETAARVWLVQELVNMGEGPSEPILDVISGSGRILRCHLRPYLRAGKDPEMLLQAFMLTANRYQGSRDELRSYLAVIVQLAQRGAFHQTQEELRGYFDRLEAAGWPAVHHSPEYQRAYRPAYRVVAREFLPEGIDG